MFCFMEGYLFERKLLLYAKNLFFSVVGCLCYGYNNKSVMINQYCYLPCNPRRNANGKIHGKKKRFYPR